MMHAALLFFAFLSVVTATVVPSPPSQEVSLRGAAAENTLPSVNEAVPSVDSPPAVPTNDFDMIRQMSTKLFRETSPLMALLPKLIINPELLLENAEALDELLPQSDIAIDETLEAKVTVMEKTLASLLNCVLNMDNFAKMIPTAVPMIVNAMTNNGPMDMDSMMDIAKTMSSSLPIEAMADKTNQVEEELKQSHELVDALSSLEEEAQRTVFLAAFQNVCADFLKQMLPMMNLISHMNLPNALPETDATEKTKDVGSYLDQTPAVEPVQA